MTSPMHVVDLRGTIGAEGANADELIAAARGASTQELRTANNIPRDHKLTEELDTDKVAKELEKDETLLDASVHGPWVVAVIELPSGRTFKRAWPAEDFGIKQRLGAKAQVHEPTQAELDEAAAARERMQEMADAQTAAADAAAKAEEASNKAKRKPAAKDADKS